MSIVVSQTPDGCPSPQCLDSLEPGIVIPEVITLPQSSIGFDQNGLWYWWDEIWITLTGPFPTYAQARISLDHYVYELQYGHPSRFT